MNRVIVYGKPQCHLCDVVKEVIDRVRARHSFEVEVRNILNNPTDQEKYKVLIPVVLLNGREIARYRLTESQLERELVSEGSKSDNGGVGVSS